MGTFIRERLWLGAVENAYDTKKLQEQGTTHILTIECSPLKDNIKDQFTCLFINAEDAADEDLLHRFDESFGFIESARQQENGGVLVHCFMGYSRSSTIVLSYLMRKEGLSLKDAMDSVKKLRNIGPNAGFLHQLRLFEKMGCAINSQDPEYKAFALEKLTDKVRQLSFGRHKVTAFKDDPHLTGAPMERALGMDPAAENPQSQLNGEDSDSKKLRLLYRCRKCRRPLARDTSFLPHVPGRKKSFGTNSHVLNRSLDAIQRRGKGEAANTDSNSDVCQEGLFFEPIEWMREQILFLEGQLTCPKPKCGAKLGHFNWVGQPCPCGHWVVPAFHLAASKVDKCVIEPAGADLLFGRGLLPNVKKESSDTKNESSATQDDLSNTVGKESLTENKKMVDSKEALPLKS